MQTEKDMTTRIIIAGSRDFDNYELLYETMKNVISLHFNNNIEIVSGHARGADRLGEQYAAEQGFPCTFFPPSGKNTASKQVL